MKVLVIGGGAREHALCRSLSQDPAVTELHCAPGNAGIAQVATVHPVDQLDGAAVAALARRLGSELVVVGPEAPLVAGVSDAVRAAGIPVFGPSGEAAQLEGSKAFAKDVMAGANVPTARSYVCTTEAEAAEALDAFGAPYVVKDDGLAAGKGVVVTTDRAEALAHAVSCERVVIEEFLDGPEVSLFAITDGVTVLPLVPAQDFKRALDGDQGPNTGGMGAYSPLPWAPEGLVQEVLETVLQPTVDELRHRGTPFSGLLYAGLALTSRGTRVIEFNARFGDPETQVVLARLRTPLAGVLLAAANGTLGTLEPLRWDEGAAVTVVIASEGYPAAPRTGDPIEGLAEVEAEGAYVLHAGTEAGQDGEVLSAGGRVLSVTAAGADLAEARELAYRGVARISLKGGQHRTDIALKAAQ
ncbi:MULTISPECIES: phosphoribosylamine--glycine ligase [unclassified Kitasatospora]|uniref:phosphoribosylamine--glycine ligase n=1 Tax=unclassified Kitasatospora TaxID=2633591 RepID=UPI00070EE6D5|nr:MULTISPECIES: phosphoribosylamine--glycine ligase [unclassified Kitasatospora]KQV19557.1 phosphoribosylamine--glycine ligase [Kitasatospora sp. Root107]KRB72924.1 phosphoribosylamine--glycine ligase [Kitasatospora sp. Root187]